MAHQLLSTRGSQAQVWREEIEKQKSRKNPTSCLATQACSAMYNPEPLAWGWYRAQQADSTTSISQSPVKQMMEAFDSSLCQIDKTNGTSTGGEFGWSCVAFPRAGPDGSAKEINLLMCGQCLQLPRWQGPPEYGMQYGGRPACRAKGVHACWHCPLRCLVGRDMAASDPGLLQPGCYGMRTSARPHTHHLS